MGLGRFPLCSGTGIRVLGFEASGILGAGGQRYLICDLRRFGRSRSPAHEYLNPKSDACTSRCYRFLGLMASHGFRVEEEQGRQLTGASQCFSRMQQGHQVEKLGSSFRSCRRRRTWEQLH